MFATLIESGGRRKTHARWLAASALIHFALLGAAAASSPQAQTRRAEPPTTPRLVWVAPRPEDVRTSSAPGISGGAGSLPIAAGRVPRFSEASVIDLPDLTSATMQSDLGTAVAAVTEFSGGNGATGISGSADAPRWAAQVEKVALPLPGNPVPDYPQVLRSAGIEGSVILRFVIDTTGGVERSSTVVLRSDHALFAAAALRALATHRFLPAEVGGRKVRMLVEQRFEFAMGSRQD